MRCKRFFLYSSALVAIMFSYPKTTFADNHLALPHGAEVKAGVAKLDYTIQNELHIHQQSNRAVLDWESFDIGKDALTQFHQNGTQAIAINRVVGPQIDPTHILGTLKSNGTVVVLDNNGVIFGQDAVLDVGGIIASTGRIDTKSFMNGTNSLEITDIDNNGSIINQGSITVAEAGIASFVAPTIINEGKITAKMGRVALASSDKVTLDLYGDGLIEIALDDTMSNALIQQKGEISADGGYIQISTAKAKSSIDNLINMDGVTSASSARVVGGKIVLEGGNIQVSGDLSANGHSGGGTILIGGDYQGKGETITAENTLITKSANIYANATDAGDGGTVIIWADGKTGFYGHAEAKGTTDGAGGFIEVSGKSYLDFNGSVDLDGGNGLGTLLLDPDDIDIVAGNTNPAEFSDDLISFSENSGSTSVIGADTITSRLDANANVVLQANNSIDVDAAITASGSGDLTLETTAGGIINVNQEINIAGAFSASTPGGTIDFDADVTAEGIDISAAAAVLSNNIELDAGFGSVHLGAVNAASHHLRLRAGDFALNDVVSGSGEISFITPRASWSLGVGDSEIGTTQADLSNSELDLLQDGFDQINFSATWGGSSIHVGARTWRDSARFSTGNRPLYVNGIQNTGANNLTFFADDSLEVNADLIGSGRLLIGISNVGSDAGVNGLSDTELSHIQDGWAFINLQSTNLTFDTDGYEFSDPVNIFLSVGSTDGTLNINDDLIAAAGSDFSFRAYDGDSVNVNAAIDLSAGNGTGGFTVEDMNSLNIGADITTAGGDITIANSVGTTVLTNVSELDADTGTITIGNGGLAAGANKLTLAATDFIITGDLTGSGTLDFAANNYVSFGLGDDATGTAHLSNAELAHIRDGFSYLNFASRYSGAITIGTTNWNANTRFTSYGSGSVTVGGNVTTDSNFRIDTPNLNLDGPITNSNANASFMITSTDDIDIGDNTSTPLLTDTELSNLGSGWRSLNFVSYRYNVNVDTNGYEFSDPLSIQGNDDISINNIDFAAGSDASLIVEGSSGTASNVYINSAIDLSQSSTGGSILFQDIDTLYLRGDLTTAGGDITTRDSVASAIGGSGIGTYTFNAGTGTISIGAGGFDSQFRRYDFIADDYYFGGNVTSGNEFSGISLSPNANMSVGLGDGQAGAINLSNQELDYLNNAPKFTLKTTDATINLGQYSNWASSAVQINPTGSLSSLNINGAQDFGSASVSFSTTTNNHNNISINDTISGTGRLTFNLFTNGIGDNVTGAYLNDSELSMIQDGFSEIRYLHARPIDINTASPWILNDNTSISTTGHPLSIHTDITASSGNNAGLNLSTNAILTVNGDIDLSPGNRASGITFENSSSLLLDGNLLTSGGDITISDSVQATSVLSDAIISADSGTISVGNNGANLHANNVELRASEINFSGAVTGTGDLQIRAETGARNIELGSADSSALNLTNLELGYLNGGFANIIIGTQPDANNFSIHNADFSGNSTNININANEVTLDGLVVGAGNINIHSASNLNLNGLASNHNQGGDVVFNVGGVFTNNVGANSIDLGTGRFIIYSPDESSLIANGLSATKVYNANFEDTPPSVFVDRKDRFIFADKAPLPTNIITQNIRDNISRANRQAITQIQLQNSQEDIKTQKIDNETSTETIQDGSIAKNSSCLVALKNSAGCVL